MPAIATRARVLTTAAEVLANYRDVRAHMRALPPPHCPPPAEPPSPVHAIIEAVCDVAGCSQETLFGEFGSEFVTSARKVALGLVSLRIGEADEIVAGHFGVLAASVAEAAERVRSIMIAFAIPLAAPARAIARVVLDNFSGPPPLGERVTIGAVKRAVCAEFGMSQLEIESDRRSHDVVIPRMIAMALAKRLTGRSLPIIGQHFGGRDHTTVIHAIRKMQPHMARAAVMVGEHAAVGEWIVALRLAWTEAQPK